MNEANFKQSSNIPVFNDNWIFDVKASISVSNRFSFFCNQSHQSKTFDVKHRKHGIQNFIFAFLNLQSCWRNKKNFLRLQFNYFI